MKKVIVNQNKFGIMVKNGRFNKVVAPGKYRVWGDSYIIECPIEDEISVKEVRVADMKDDESFVSNAECVTVPAGHIAVHMVDGFYQGVVGAGNHAFWRAAGEHEFIDADVRDYRLEGKFSEDILRSLGADYNSGVSSYIVEEKNVGVLFVDGVYQETLNPGRYMFYAPSTGVEGSLESPVQLVEVPSDTVDVTIPYQEVLTSDKAEVRVNLTVYYNIVDYVKYGMSINKAQSALYNACKLALREACCNMTLDQLLESRDAIGELCLKALADKVELLGVEIVDAGVMDMVLPGNIREIMNQVLVAEKKAQANVITRREEVASTRSLLNTAKMMDDNPTLYRLKELECLERICGNVGSINVGGGSEALNQLLGLLKK